MSARNWRIAAGVVIAGTGAAYAIIRVIACLCIIIIPIGRNVPDAGPHTMEGAGGQVILNTTRVATLESLTVNMDNSLDPNDPGVIVAGVTSVSGTVGSVWSVNLEAGPSTWSLGAATPGCPNQLRFDKNQPPNPSGNVSGCMVLDVTGAFNQTGIETFVDGTNFDPNGIDPIDARAESTNFDFAAAGFTPSEPIPTLSQWGLLLLALVLLSGGVLLIHRRRQVRAG